MVYRILAHWDAAAGVWWAESTDVRGLVAEANTFEGLVANLHELVPELLKLNHGTDQLGEVAELSIMADRAESIPLAG
jgi:predicted RNase H-like HicB family nuclease